MARSPVDGQLVAVLERAEVIFGAFRAHGAAMLAEWSVSYEHDIMRDCVRFGFHHKRAEHGSGMVLVSALVDGIRVYEAYRHESHIPIHIERVMPDSGVVRMMGHLSPVWGSAAAKAEPATPWRELTVPEYYGFLKPTTGGDIKTPEGIIVDPSNIGEVLELIRKVQAPEQAAIRERARRGERPLEQTATILTLAA